MHNYYKKQAININIRSTLNLIVLNHPHCKDKCKFQACYENVTE